MTDISMNNKETDRLVKFLIEDLKETGEHLRDTDRKLSFLIQIYTGTFVLITSLTINNIIKLDALLGIPGLLLFIVIGFFTWWLFVYSLKSKETKVVYIQRMNFLRREMHYFLKNKHKYLPGYWTSSELTNVMKQMQSNVLPDEGIKPKRVGLDDLYPSAMQGILVILVLPITLALSAIVSNNPIPNLDTSSKFLPCVIFFSVAIIILLLTRKQGKDSEKSIQYQVWSYNLSSEELDQTIIDSSPQPETPHATKEESIKS